MIRIALLAALVAVLTFIGACISDQTQQAPVVSTNGSTITPAPDDQYWAKNNFDLQRVGDLVQRSRSPEEFERYLNRPGGINNLDLNGDGYVDYISVREYDDLNDPNCRGLSMYTQYGPDQIQEIGTVTFYRDDPQQYQGARVLVYGDPTIYGDNVYYETNWLDRSVQLVSFLFGGNRQVYSTPYYYENYPTWYETYEVVDAPVYERRVVELYPQPVVVYTRQPAFVNKIRIRSPYDGRNFGEVHAMLVKPTREQENFIKANPRPVHLARGDRNRKGDEARTDEGRPNDLRRGDQPDGERPAKTEPERPVAEREPKQPKQPKAEASRGEHPKVARVNNPKPARPNNPGRPAHVERPQPVRTQAVKSQPTAKPAKAQGNPNHGGGGGGNGKSKGKKPGE